MSPSKAKAVYTLLPFTQVLVAGLKTDPSMLPASVFKRTHSSGDDAELAFPILVRLVGCDESEDVPRVNLPLAPRDRIALGLEFSNFMCCGSTGESAEFDLRIDVEYISGAFYIYLFVFISDNPCSFFFIIFRVPGDGSIFVTMC